MEESKSHRYRLKFEDVAAIIAVGWASRRGTGPFFDGLLKGRLFLVVCVCAFRVETPGRVL